MRYTTKTGIGYFEDEQGRVIDYYRVTPGEHAAGGPRAAAVDVESPANLPDVDDEYQAPPSASTPPSFEERVRAVLRDEGLL